VNLSSYLVERVTGLGPPQTRDLTVQRDLPVPTPDGTILLTDRWAPKVRGWGRPVALLRSPYGRRGLIGTGMARPLAERSYTTAPLGSDVEVIGEVSAEIWFRSSLRHADVFARLCDVDPDGRSRNVCDGLVSLTGADELSCARVRLWPTAHRFRAGHRIRLQVSSGAFPRYARNLGTGEPLPNATALRVADQEVHHDPGHASAVLLPVG
jgi:predicted acyl esterase